MMNSIANKSKVVYGLSFVVKAVGLFLSIGAPLYGIFAYFLLGAEHPVNMAFSFIGASDQFFLGRSFYDLWLAILLYLMLGLTAAAFFGFLYRKILARAESEVERIAVTSMQTLASGRNSAVLEGADLRLVAGQVDKFMNEMLHAAILEAIMDAAKKIGWQFAYTDEVHELASWHRQHIAEVIWPAREAFVNPLIKINDPERNDRWTKLAIDDGWSANWLDQTLAALREIGIRPVPYMVLTESSQTDQN